MLNFFRQKPKESVFKKIGVDIHSHLLAGIDDGSPDLETSTRLIKGLYELGFSKIITTPHIFSDYYPNTSIIIRERLHQLNTHLTEHRLLPLEAAAEYYVDSHLEQLVDKDDLLTIGKSKIVLIELSFIAPAFQLQQTIFNLITKGYQPVLAHPERYTYWHQRTDVFENLKEVGCQMQLNLLSLTGYYGAPVKKKALSLLKSHCIDYVGTDLHHQNHLQALQKHQFDQELAHWFDAYPFKNKFIV